ncbi:class E sortase [Rubrobacter aplysinae]|uniref:class E sortase n=1 Tax=Rubrobacter aplysinae TaxID=909625 RepID=UPI00064BC8FE|nr:class E sortase [Rubrobacter aplysinae]
MRPRSLLLILACVTLVFALSACGSSEESGSGGGQDQSGDTQKEEENKGEKTQQESTRQKESTEQAAAPQDKTLKVSVPKMQNVNNATIPNVPYTQQAINNGVAEQGLKNHAAIHVDSTGYPWQEEANVYLAGHALGYENTPSWHAFRDLDNLKKGDKIFVEDANGKQYTYEVFRESFDVEPTQVEVIQPKEGRNILSLQSCTLPDYEDRVIVQAELVEA